MARPSRPEHRLGMYRDRAFYVSIGWRAVASAIAVPRQLYGAAIPHSTLPCRGGANRVARCLPDR
jgi:hypothetical protein